MIKTKAKKMLLFTMMIVSILTSSFIATVPAFAEEDCVYLYADKNYGGDWIKVTASGAIYDKNGRYYNTYPAVPAFMNDRIDSFRIYGNVQIQLFEHDRTVSTKACLFQFSRTSIDYYGLHDNISTICIEPRNSPGLYLYTGLEQTGTCMKVGEYGNYPYSACSLDLSKIGMNNSVKSMRYLKSNPNSSPKINVQLYDDINLWGSPCFVQLDFVNYNGGFFNSSEARANLPISFYNRASSVYVTFY